MESTAEALSIDPHAGRRLLNLGMHLFLHPAGAVLTGAREVRRAQRALSAGLRGVVRCVVRRGERTCLVASSMGRFED